MREHSQQHCTFRCSPQEAVCDRQLRASSTSELVDLSRSCKIINAYGMAAVIKTSYSLEPQLNFVRLFILHTIKLSLFVAELLEQSLYLHALQQQVEEILRVRQQRGSGHLLRSRSLIYEKAVLAALALPERLDSLFPRPPHGQRGRNGAADGEGCGHPAEHPLRRRHDGDVCGESTAQRQPEGALLTKEGVAPVRQWARLAQGPTYGIYYRIGSTVAARFVGSSAPNEICQAIVKKL